MNKVFFTLLICLLMSTVSQAKIGDRFQVIENGIRWLYTVIADGEVEVGFDEMGWYYESTYYVDSLIIPSEVRGYKVTRIADSGFEELPDFETVVMPEGLRTIGKRAFRKNSMLVNVVFPENLEVIGEEAFYGCVSLEEINLKNHVKAIHESAFWGCYSMRELRLSEELQTIENWAFAYCRNLKSLYLPKNVSYIHGSSLWACLGLESIEVAEDNPYFDSRNNSNAVIKKEGDVLVCGCSTTIIPLNVRRIGDDAFCFQGNKPILHEGIPNSVESIGMDAFTGCTFDSLLITKNVKVIDDMAFSGCTFLVACKIEEGGLKVIGNGAFERAKIPGLTIPLSVEVIGERAFSQSTIQSAVIPSAIKTVSNHAFDDCRELKSLELQEGVEIIGDGAFSGCKKLVFNDIKFPSTLRVIEKGAFSYCNLSYIKIPDGVVKIGPRAFQYCNVNGFEPTSVFLPASLKEIGDSAFFTAHSVQVTTAIPNPLPIKETVFTCYHDGHDKLWTYRSNGVLTVPKGCADLYKATYPWSLFKNIREIEHIGIDQQTTSKAPAVEKARYTVGGVKTKSHIQGLTIVEMSDGSRCKVMVK